MKWPFKRLRKATRRQAVMLVLRLVVLALLAAFTIQSGIPRYIRGEWVLADEDLQYDDGDELAAEEVVWPESPAGIVDVATDGQILEITLRPETSEKEQGEAENSNVWKILLVVTSLLVSVLGCVIMTYYMCIWRGGRIHYQPQKEVYA